MSIRVGLALLFLVGLVGGCSSTPPSTNEPAPFNQPPTESTCVEGDACSCSESRLRGKTTCQGKVQSCDCSACESERPAAVPTDTFVACGGEPFGTWVGSSAPLSAPMLTGDDACDPIITKEDSPLSFILDLKDGGSGAMLSYGGDYEQTKPSQCLKEGYCESYGYKSDAECGRCMYTTRISSGAVNDLHWTRTGTQLTLDHPYDYCVNGDELSLHISFTGTVAVLKRAQLVGKPDGCFARSLETCEQPNKQLDACHKGACIGDLSCSGAAQESDCTNRKGCSWDTTKCDGTAATTCAIEDYGFLPGCDVMPQP